MHQIHIFNDNLNGKEMITFHLMYVMKRKVILAILTKRYITKPFRYSKI